MFHVEQFSPLFLLLGVAVAPLPCSAELFSADARAQHSVLLGADLHEEQTRLSNLGYELFLLGAEEEARAAFQEAARYESSSALNDVGLILTAGTKEERSKAIQKLHADIDEETLTPQETFFLKTILLFVKGDTRGAAEEFLSHAVHYRRDRVSMSWGILLLHYAAKDDATQQRCIDLASEFRQRYPEDSIAGYLRALCEEFYSSSEISEEALLCAQEAANKLPHARRLYGHLLFRKGRMSDALEVFHVEHLTAEKNSYAQLSAQLYEATALWSLGRSKDALQCRRELNSALPFIAEPKTKAELLWRWEANTLPLRVLIATHDRIDYSDITAAKKVATGNNKSEQGSVAHFTYCRCLVHLALSRYHLQKGKKGDASRFLVDAERDFGTLRSATTFRSSFEQSLFSRACLACEQGILLVKEELYDTTADTWRADLKEIDIPSSLLLPPVLPRR